MPPSSPISHVSDTARWVAVYRAMESERPDALFRDPHARRLAGDRGEDIVRAMPKGRAWAWPMVVRTAVFDELILRAVARDGVRTVLNLAAGLDTRAYRLPLPQTLHWIDVDLPAMTEYKQTQMSGERPACRLEYVPLDLADRAGRQGLFARVGSAAPVLVVSEGLLVYLAPQDVAALAADLYAQPSFHWWLIDLASPRLLRMLERNWGRRLAAGGAPMRFAPAEGTRFFEVHGWVEAEFRPTFDEARRLNRAPRASWLWRLLARLSPPARREEFRRMAGIVLLRRA